MDNIKIKIDPNNWSKKFHSKNGYDISINGQVYINEKIYSQDQIVGEYDNKKEFDIENFLSVTNGFFAIIGKNATNLFAAVDIVRSIPLFYSLHQGMFYISDDAEWVRKQVGNNQFDPVSEEEFQLTGYVTGSETLFPDVKQLQAGEYLKVNVTDEGISLSRNRYYTFSHYEPEKFDEERLLKELDLVTENAMKRLIEHANGRQIVIPLSGGYDSRLIAAKLCQLGYKNIISFTYGIPGNKDSAISKSIALSLNLDWYFVEYNDDKWKEAWQSSEFWNYMYWATNWCSIGHVQDWLAVKELKSENIIDDQAIFVPGHSGDFVAGSHIPEEAFLKNSFNKSDISAALFQDHYKITPIRLVRRRQKFWTDRIQKQLISGKKILPWEYADLYEKWDWQERQSKFICNSVRVYEHFGFNFWLPLWDEKFVRFWEQIPLQLRQERRWYNEFVDDLYKNISSDTKSDYANPEKSALKKVILNIIPYESRNNVSKYLHKLKKLFSFDKNKLLLNGIVGVGLFKTMYLLKSGYSPLGILVKEFLKRTKNNEY